MSDLDALPVDSFREAAPFLRRPFTTEAVRFKVQSSWSSGALIVGYIDAHLVIERLNLVCPHLWYDRYEPTSTGLMWCHLTVGDITRSDVGDGQGKGLVSDALKRAAVKFGVGVSLKRLPRMVATDQANHIKRKAAKGKETVALTSSGEQHIRGLYKRWLESAGEGFGAPLDHGDIAGAVGDHEVAVAAQNAELLAAAMEAMELAGIDPDTAEETVNGASDDKLREITARAIAAAKQTVAA